MSDDLIQNEVTTQEMKQYDNKNEIPNEQIGLIEIKTEGVQSMVIWWAKCQEWMKWLNVTLGTACQNSWSE